MTTGNSKKAENSGMNRATGLRFDRDRMILRLKDGREVWIPLEHYPTLRRATPAQRQEWELLGGGRGFHWKSLDLDLSTDGLVQGYPERIPRPPSVKPGKLAAPSVAIAERRRKRPAV